MQIWAFIENKFKENIDVVLLCVLHSKGSSPGRQGFKMAVARNGTVFGSIGGGIMEHKFLELAKSTMAENVGRSGIYKQVHDKDAGKNKSGMICSGEQTIFLYQLQPRDRPHILLLLQSMEESS